MRTRGPRPRHAALPALLVVAGVALTGCTTSSYTCVNSRCHFTADGPASTTIGVDQGGGTGGLQSFRVAVDQLRDGSVRVSVQGERRILRQGETFGFRRARVTATKATAGKVRLDLVR